MTVQTKALHPMTKGSVAQLESPQIINKFNCLNFQYLFERQSIGRLNVFLLNPGEETRLVWRVAANEGIETGKWHSVVLLLRNDRSNKVNNFFHFWVLVTITLMSRSLSL